MDLATRSCSTMPLVRLLRRIVDKTDAGALNEFHERKLFIADGRRLRFIDFVQWLAGREDLARIGGLNRSIPESAFDLLTDKFTLLPADPSRKHEGPDVRFYLGACLRFLESDPVMRATKNPIKRELRAAEALQNLVKRHFILSVLEARRRLRTNVRRLCWRIDGRVIYLWLPREMSADACWRWLSERRSEFARESGDLRERIQERINSELWLPRILSTSDAAVAADLESPDIPEKWSLEREISVKGLAEVVAQEKADNLALQRPAIQALGPPRLKTMILRIFEELAGGSYLERDIALSFDLSPASFSRFAGSQWARTAGGSVKVPDLWRNTAQTLSRHRVFVESAKDAGVWPSVQAVLAQRTQRGSDDDT